eukprot:scaffold7045_cov18-Tisochrysis_lutea.AAC.2
MPHLMRRMMMGTRTMRTHMGVRRMAAYLMAAKTSSQDDQSLQQGCPCSTATGNAAKQPFCVREASSGSRKGTQAACRSSQGDTVANSQTAASRCAQVGAWLMRSERAWLAQTLAWIYLDLNRHELLQRLGVFCVRGRSWEDRGVVCFDGGESSCHGI